VGSTRNIDIKPSNSENVLTHSSSTGSGMNRMLGNRIGNSSSGNVGISNNDSSDDLKRSFVKPPLQRQMSYDKGKISEYIWMIMIMYLMLL